MEVWHDITVEAGFINLILKWGNPLYEAKSDTGECRIGIWEKSGSKFVVILGHGDGNVIGTIDWVKMAWTLPKLPDFAASEQIFLCSCWAGAGDYAKYLSVSRGVKGRYIWAAKYPVALSRFLGAVEERGEGEEARYYYRNHRDVGNDWLVYKDGQVV